MRISLAAVQTAVVLASILPAAAQLAARDPQTMPCGATHLTAFRMDTSGPHSVAAIHFLDGDGDLVSPSMFFTGSFHSLCKQNRFLLVADDVHFGVTHSFLMRGDGARVAELNLGWGPTTSVSDDHRVFWVETHEADNAEETRLRVFDFDGKELFDQRYREKGAIVELEFGGSVYRINVRDPDLPG